MPFRLSPQYFNPSLYQTIRKTWFDGIPDAARVPPEHAVKRWFGANSKAEKEAFDRRCHDNFRAALDSIGPDAYPLPAMPSDGAAEAQQAPDIAQPFLAEIESAETPETPASTALSMFLLLDQMTRNIFRGDQRRIYAHYDRISRALTYTMLQSPADRRWDLKYQHNLVCRGWFYMPLMHSEHVEDHRTLQNLYNDVLQDVTEEGVKDGREYIEKQMAFEKMHMELVERFGRYPHRNTVMGREPTAEERDYLSSDGAQTFGTG